MKRSQTVNNIAAASLVALATVLVYLPALKNGFVNWDDDDYVYKNTLLKTIDGRFVNWAFFHFHAANWHPLTWLSHALDYAVWGLDPAGHHLTNVILHAANSFIVVLLAARLLKIARPGSDREPIAGSARRRIIPAAAFVTGLLFGLHPLHVESVAWIAERKDVLCAFFFLLSLLLYLRYMRIADGGSRVAVRFLDTGYLLVLFFFLAALLSKAMAVTLPVVLLLLDWYPLGRCKSAAAFRVAALEKAPFFLLSLCSSVITVLAQHSQKAIASLASYSFSDRMAVAAAAFSGYLGKMILPVHLLPFYAYPRQAVFFSVQFLVSVLVAAVLALSCIWAWRRSHAWVAGWIYYAVTLLPVLGLVQVGFQAMADRYTYLPSLGPFLLAGTGVQLIVERTEAWQGKKLVRILLPAIVAAASILLAVKTMDQITVWRNSLRLWNYEIENQSQTSPIVYYHRGIAYQDERQYQDAVSDYNSAIALKKDYYEAYNNRGSIYDSLGQYKAAIKDYTYSLDLMPDPRVYTNRGVCHGLLGQFSLAVQDFDRAIAMDPEESDAYANRGFVYLKIGDIVHAMQDLRKACEAGRDNACRALQNLQNTRLNAGKGALSERRPDVSSR